MSDVYPIFYGTRLVTFDVIRNTFEPHMHPEAAVRGFGFLLHQGGKFGIGGGYRPPGTQPTNKPGFAPPGKSFHEGQPFPSGVFYVAWDLVVVNPGYRHRAPLWDEVPEPYTQLANDYGMHVNVSGEPWHMQPKELFGHGSWVKAGRPDLQFNYPIVVSPPRRPPAQPPVPETQPASKEITVQFTSRTLENGHVGPDVKFFQRQLNEVAGQGLVLDGHFGNKTEAAVKNWQQMFKLEVDGMCGPNTQRSIIEISLMTS